MQNQNDIKLGRFLSLVLRHDPAAAGITLDENGWATVEDLLTGVRAAGWKIDQATLERIVQENNKKRYNFNGDSTKIRANQGHSVEVDVELQERQPPDVLYHGTATRFLDSIRQSGLTRQSRRHVHLSAEMATAANVGSRHGKPVVLRVDASAMARDGHIFWLSENGVWLCETVPWQYISCPE